MSREEEQQGQYLKHSIFINRASRKYNIFNMYSKNEKVNKTLV